MAALPKLSYVLLSYNREKYIRRAIESAFAQDYEGEMEYIFSDDCSTDRTFEIIQECVAAYKGGRRVVVTRTPHNCHLAGNTNHAVSFISPDSDWVIRADDDDIATPDRCSIIGKAIAEHPEAKFVYTTEKHFTDASEERILQLARAPRKAPCPVTICDERTGRTFLESFFTPRCSHRTWHVRVYRDFGDLPLEGYYVDDVISALRASMLGTGLRIQADTVYIRDGSNNMCRGGDDGKRGYRAIVRQEKFNDRYFNITLPPIKAEYGRCRQLQSGMNPAEAATVENLLSKMEEDIKSRELYATYWRKGMLNRRRINKHMGWNDTYSKLRCLPLWLFAAIVSTGRTLKHWFKK